MLHEFVEGVDSKDKEFRSLSLDPLSLSKGRMVYFLLKDRRSLSLSKGDEIIAEYIL